MGSNQMAGVLWALIKWESADGKITHAVCDSVNLIPLSNDNKMPDKAVLAYIDGKKLKASIVIISDDKNLLHNEMLKEIQLCGGTSHLLFADDGGESNSDVPQVTHENNKLNQNTQTTFKPIDHTRVLPSQFNADLKLAMDLQSTLLAHNNELSAATKRSSAQMARLSADITDIKSLLIDISSTLTDMDKNEHKFHINGLDVVDEVEVTMNEKPNQTLKLLTFVGSNDDNAAELQERSDESWRHTSIAQETPKRKSAKKGRKAFKLPKPNEDENEDVVAIGDNGTLVSSFVLNAIDWTSHSVATRTLLITLFTRDVLASHTLTGKPSPAFMDREKPKKGRLDEKIIADIIKCVKERSNVTEAEVRSVITTKCADEHKMKATRVKKERVVLASIGNDEIANQTI